jgi:hypothetical protein
MTLSLKQRQVLQQNYLYLTSEKLPALVSARNLASPVTENHCFQRIVLDNLCGGQWTEFIAPPAYLNMTDTQLVHAESMCLDVISGELDLFVLNRNSLLWRKISKDKQLTLFN